MDSPTAYPDDVRLRPTSTESPERADSWPQDFPDLSPSNCTNASANSTLFAEEISYKYIYVSTAMVIFCAVSVVINIKVLASAYWIKRPLSPTLHISLSLAGADAFASFNLGLGLFINSLLEKGFKVLVPPYLPILVEVFRLGGVIITVAHLLALAVNHYLGIIKPLHYPSIMTHRNRTICLVLMWIIPISFLLIYFSVIENQGFQHPYADDFVGKSQFRLTYSSMFFCPLILMSIIYTHIYFIVRRHQQRRQLFSQWSQYNRENGDFTRSSNQQRDIAMSIKAIKTTLLILGSYIVGLMPAALFFVFVCDDCLTTREIFVEGVGGEAIAFPIFVFVNFLVIFKTMLNPIIYAARMHEIKKASSIMKARICRCCCHLIVSDNDAVDNPFGASSDGSQGLHRLTQYTSETTPAGNPHRSNTVICRMRSGEPTANGAGRTKSLSRTSTRSHQRRRAELTLV